MHFWGDQIIMLVESDKSLLAAVADTFSVLKKQQRKQLSWEEHMQWPFNHCFNLPCHDA